MMDTGAPATSEEQDASTALQSLQFSGEKTLYVVALKN